jgi:hypothetical protein
MDITVNSLDLRAIQETIEPYRPFIKVAHHIPGRIRLKAGLGILKVLKKKDLPSIGEVEGIIKDILDQINGVGEVRLNPKAGTIIIEYDSDLIHQHIFVDLFTGSDDLLFKRALQELHHIVVEKIVTK